MLSKQRTIVWLLVLVLAVPSMAMAVRKGRLIGKVVDPEGNPIEGVTVIATCDAVSRYREVDTTDKKGLFKVDFDYLDVVYKLHFEKVGFHSLDSEQTWHLEGTSRDEFIMYPGESTVGDVPLASTSNQAIYFFNQGAEAFNLEDFATAEARFREALEHDPELHQAWAALAKIHIHLEQWQEAVDAAEKAIALGSTDETVWRSRWEGYRQLGDEEKTLQALKDLEDAGVRTAEAQRIYNEGVALTKSGDHQGAFDAFNQALEIDPNLSPAIVGVATAAVELGRHKEAAEAAKKILNSDPENEAALRIRYNAALAMGDEDEIVGALLSLAAVEPEISRNSLLKLAYDAYDANDMARAKKLFKNVLEVDPRQPQAHYVLALIYVNDNENDKAIPHLEKFLEVAPDDPEAVTAGELLNYLKGA